MHKRYRFDVEIVLYNVLTYITIETSLAMLRYSRNNDLDDVMHTKDNDNTWCAIV